LYNLPPLMTEIYFLHKGHVFLVKIIHNFSFISKVKLLEFYFIVKFLRIRLKIFPIETFISYLAFALKHFQITIPFYFFSVHFI